MAAKKQTDSVASNSSLKDDYKKFSEEGKINYLDPLNGSDKIIRIVHLLKNGGSYDDLTAFRTRKKELKRHIENLYNSNIALTSTTTRTDLFKSFIVQIIIRIYKRTIKVPVFDIKAVNDSQTSYEAKTQASIVKATLDWFLRNTGYDNIVKKSRDDQFGYGNRYIQPFVRKVQNSSKTYPSLKRVSSDNILLDPNCSALSSEDYAEQAQFFATTTMYPTRNLKSRFGEWICDYASPGYTVDSDRYGIMKGTDIDEHMYEVLEVQDKSSGEEYCLVGGTAFPVMANVQGEFDIKPTKDLKKILDDNENPMVWTNEYKYKDSFGENVLMLSDAFTYFNADDPRDWGLADEQAIMQIIHEITENLKIDNTIKKLEQTPYLIGGSMRTDKTLEAYRKEKKINRHAIWNIPQGIGKATPEPGVIKFDGITAEEGTRLTEDVFDLSRDISGVDPQQQEIQKNTAVTQTQIIEEKAIAAIESIAENNMPNYEHELRVFLAFIIAHKGFGLDDVKIKFTLYDENTPEGDDNATISLPNAAKKIEKYEFSVDIDNSSLIKRSRFSETQQWLDLLKVVDPTVTPEWFIHIAKKVASIGGMELPEVQKEQVQQMQPQGGMSQFSGGAPSPNNPNAPVDVQAPAPQTP